MFYANFHVSYYWSCATKVEGIVGRIALQKSVLPSALWTRTLLFFLSWPHSLV